MFCSFNDPLEKNWSIVLTPQILGESSKVAFFALNMGLFGTSEQLPFLFNVMPLGLNIYIGVHP